MNIDVDFINESVEKYMSTVAMGQLKGNTLYYTDFEEEETQTSDEKKLKLREVNLEILENGDSEELQDQIKEIESITVNDPVDDESGSGWGSGTLSGSVASSSMNIINVVVKQKVSDKISISMSLDETTVADSNIDPNKMVFDYIIKNIHDQFYNVIKDIPRINLVSGNGQRETISLFQEINHYTVEQRGCHVFGGSEEILKKINRTDQTNLLKPTEIFLSPRKDNSIIFGNSKVYKVIENDSFRTKVIFECILDIPMDLDKYKILELSDQFYENLLYL